MPMNRAELLLLGMAIAGVLDREKEYFSSLFWRVNVVDPVIFSLLLRTSFSAASFSRLNSGSVSSRDP